ncbi:TolC family protein [Candidatus Dependentiae bacterium]
MNKSIKISFAVIFFICTLIKADKTINIKNTTHKKLKLTMQEVVKMAHKNRPSLKAYKFATQASKQDEKKAISGYFPQVTLNEQPFFQNGLKGLQNSISLQTNQLVYSFAGPIQQYKIAKKITESSKYQEETHKDLVRYQVEVAFLQSWLLQRKNKYIEFLEKSSNQDINKSEHENKLNLLDKNDWLNDAATYSQNMYTVYSYSDQLYDAKNQLEYYIGKPFKSETSTIILTWDSAKQISLKQLEYYYQKAINNRKEIKQKQKEVEQYMEYQSFYKKTYLPSLSISGKSGRTSGIKNNSIGAVFTWNMLDGGANYHESNKANANKLKAIMEKENYVQQAKFDVQKSYYELATLLKQLVSQSVRLRQAENEFVLKKQEFNIGTISKVDLESAKYNWESQKFNWITSKINTSIKQRELYYSCGYPQDF